jgi:hypothetical protein
VQIEEGYNKLERTKIVLQLAAETVKLRTEGERITQDQLTKGVVLVSARRQASAAQELAQMLARAKLEQTIGPVPGSY